MDNGNILNNEKHGLIKRQGLSDIERAEAEQLSTACNLYEGLDLPVNYEPETPARGEETSQFLYYEHGKLVGFASIQAGQPLEACGMVHPEYRRRGIGRALVAALQAERKRRNRDDLLVVCDEVAQSGKAFMASVGAHYTYSEHRMLLEPSAIEWPRTRHKMLRFRRADATDIEAIVQIMVAAFGHREDTVRRFVERSFQDANQFFCVADLRDKSQNPVTVGTLRVGKHNSTIYITAFAVLPAFQGRGYGRQLLADTIDMLLAEKHEDIRIEVETENRNALGLYKSCGFRETTTYGYYVLE